MAYDGIVTMAVARQLAERLTTGKIDKVYQPEADELVFNIHTRQGNVKLYASVDPAAARVHLIEESLPNPPAPLSFCMLLRKHIQGARIIEVCQKGSERILEISLETLNELGFTVSKKLIFEIMGKHSNIVLVDLGSGRIIDCIKHVSIDVSRVRQLLPGLTYQYPPAQDKTPFKEAAQSAASVSQPADSKLSDGQLSAGQPTDGKSLQRTIAGISAAFAEEMAAHSKPLLFLQETVSAVQSGQITPVVYCDEKKAPREFYVVPLAEYEDVCEAVRFETISSCLEYYYAHKQSTNRARQKASDLIRAVSAQLEKLALKQQRLGEDLLKAENSEDLRLFGELLTANIHAVTPGASQVTVTNYYDGTPLTIPLDPRFSAAKNAQLYFKRYGKAKTAVKEKQLQLEANGQEIAYLESVLSYLENAGELADIEALRRELEETGYIRKRKLPGGFREKKAAPAPYRYTLKDGSLVMVGRNNKENDFLTFKLSAAGDIWLHTKDIPGSHVLLRPAAEISEETIYAAAAIAAYYSKARSSENVPVDYVPIRLVKKPAGARPGMVIFTGNRTVWVSPRLPE